MIYRITSSYSKKMQHASDILNVLAFVGWVIFGVLLADGILLYYHLIKL